MKTSPFRRGLVAATAALALVPATLPYAQAEIVDTPVVLSAASRTAQLDKLEATLQRADVAAQLEQFGVGADAVQQRLQAMTDAELQAFAQRLDQAPAGGDGFALVGVVFVVLIILELVGVIDIFKKV
jgi:hypothetical protein